MSSIDPRSMPSGVEPVDIEKMTQRLTRLREAPTPDGPLPAHHPQCLGCGPDNPHGHQLQARRAGDHIVAEHVFDTRHVGAPGIAHGGAVATVFDDLLGFALYLVGEPAVTRRLTVNYSRPVLLGVEYTLKAWVVTRSGRAVQLSAHLSPTGEERTVARADAEFAIVGLDHFLQATQ
jgi:acyl-coenzyme A thioesterase PaaI-like protein